MLDFFIFAVKYITLCIDCFWLFIERETEKRPLFYLNFE